MRTLSLAVAAFALAALLVGLKQPDTMTFLLAAAAAASAATAFLSTSLSTFLKIFKTIFAVETIVFGLAFLIDRMGLWPKGYEAYTLPESLPLAVSLFGVLVYAISFIPLVGRMMNIVDRYFNAAAPTQTKVWPLPAMVVAQNKLAAASLVFLIVINQVEVALDVRLSYFRADFTNALKNADQAEFWRQLLFVFTPVVAVLVASYTLEYVVTSTFVIRWRRWLTADYTAQWLRHGVHYKMLLEGGDTDNPDQRISQDIYAFIDGTGSTGSGAGLYNYSVTALQNLTSLVSYAIVLWTLSSGVTLPGLALVIPGVLFWVALVYTGLGTAVTHWIGRSLTNLYFAQQRLEANFRFGLARAREYSEQIALLNGEFCETSASNGRFGDVYDNYMRIVKVRKWLTTFTRSYGQASVLIPYVVAAPFYFLGKISMGALNQVGAAFNAVNESMNFFVTYYIGLADFRATFERLATFDEAIARAEAADARAPHALVAPAAATDISIDDLSLALPDGRALARIDHLAFAAGQPTLLVGPSGSGKSTLFRAIAGIWPFGRGAISEPAGARVMLLPQRPYIPIGPLRDALAYPASAAAFSDETLRGALTNAGLPALVDKLDESDNWQMRLSGGEQQRLAVARALLAAPNWLFLDEATASLDEKSEADLYRAIARTLPKTTLVSIGHRSTLSAFHKRRITLNPQVGGPATIVAAEAAE
ncbi:MAG TPA: ABC transporter ATP-binding protein/permease [Roseiarcus sp.]|nr:ABC transporter ATP-binding protein/permease [Roseiarcus sp.]